MKIHDPRCPYGENCLACNSELKEWHTCEWILHDADLDQKVELMELLVQEIKKDLT